jgi:hypothetical protein
MIKVRYFLGAGPTSSQTIRIINPDGQLADIVFQAQGCSISDPIKDLQGTWNFHSLVADGIWAYGQMIIDTNGVMTNTSIVRSNNDNTLLTPLGLSIGTDRVITSGSPTMHGRLNSGGDLFVITGDTYHPNKVNNYLTIMQKAGVSTFTTSDLVGTWNFRGLGSGNGTQWNGWLHGQVEIDANGVAAASTEVVSSGGGVVLPSETLSISSNGIVTMGATSFHGVMSQDHNLIVGTGTFSSGGWDGYGLIIIQKAEGTYQISDLAGDWQHHGLVTGYVPYHQIGWFYGEEDTDVNGNVAWLSYLDSLGLTSLPGSGSFYIDSSGIVTSSIPSFHGVMNPGKDMMVYTFTGYPSLNTSVGGYVLGVVLK